MYLGEGEGICDPCDTSAKFNFEFQRFLPRSLTNIFSLTLSSTQDRIEKHKEEVEELEALEKVVEEETPKNVRVSQR